MIKKFFIIIGLTCSMAQAKSPFDNPHGDNLYLLSKVLVELENIGEYFYIKPSDDQKTRERKVKIQKAVQVSLKIGLAIGAVELLWLLRYWAYSIGAYFDFEWCMTSKQIIQKYRNEECHLRIEINKCLERNSNKEGTSQPVSCECGRLLAKYKRLAPNKDTDRQVNFFHKLYKTREPIRVLKKRNDALMFQISDNL